MNATPFFDVLAARCLILRLQFSKLSFNPFKDRYFFATSCLTFCTVLTFAASAGAQTSSPGAVTKPQYYLPQGTPPNYCGVCALYRAFECIGKPTAFDELLRPQYVSTNRGSKLADLQRALDDFGLHHAFYSGATCRTLRACQSPVILHVKNSPSAASYNHWILYAGCDNGMARIYDGTEDVRFIDFAQVSARWDGNALVISAAPIPSKTIWFARASEYLMNLGCALCAIALLYLTLNRARKRFHGAYTRFIGRLPMECIPVVALAVILGLGADLVDRTAVLADASFISYLQSQHAPDFLPQINYSDLRERLKHQDLVVLDARYADDYNDGHIPGAVSMPPNMPPGEFQTSLEKIPASAKIVIYCQSKTCPYSATLATKILREGYWEIAFYREGWEEWQTQER